MNAAPTCCQVRDSLYLVDGLYLVTDVHGMFEIRCVMSDMVPGFRWLLLAIFSLLVLYTPAQRCSNCVRISGLLWDCRRILDSIRRTVVLVNQEDCPGKTSRELSSLQRHLFTWGALIFAHPQAPKTSCAKNGSHVYHQCSPWSLGPFGWLQKRRCNVGEV